MGLRQTFRWASAVVCLVSFGCGDDKSNGKDGGGEDDAGAADGGSDAGQHDAGDPGPQTLCSEPYGGTPWKSADLREPGPFEIGKVIELLVDTTRQVPANGTFAGADMRSLNTSIWYPATTDGLLAEGGPFPLVVWSHGFTSSADEVEYLAELLASRGYLVAAPTFPLASFGAPGGSTSEDFQNLPGDISFVIDTMLAKSADEANALSGAVDPDRIAVGGLSMGATVSLFVTFHKKVLDERIKATVLLAGSGIYYLDSFFETRKDLPLLVMHGDLDAVIPYDPSGLALRGRSSPSWFMTVKKGSHAGFSGFARSSSGNPDSIGCASIAKADPNRPSSDETLIRLGGEEVGIAVPKDKPEACTIDPLPKSISALRQQELTTPVVYAFFESVFAKDNDRRNAGCQYVEQGASADNVELSIDLH